MPVRLKVILACHIVLALTYSVLSPLFEPPDEHWHFAYVRHLAEARRLPRLGVDSSLGQQASQPPLYYAIAAALTGWVPAESQLEGFLKPNPFWCASTDVTDNQNRLVHGSREQLPWRDVALGVHLSRFVSVLFGSGAVASAWLLVGEVIPGRSRMRSAATALVAFNPQFIFISGAVSNDAALVAFSTFTLWLLARGLRRGFDWPTVLWAGSGLGLAMLAKPTALALLPTALLALAMRLWVRPKDLVPLRTVIWRGAALLAIALLTGGWWYVRSAALYGDPLSVGGHLESEWAHDYPSGFLYTLRRFGEVATTYWAAFGWGNVRWPSRIYDLLSHIVCLAGIGLVAALVSIWRQRQHRNLKREDLAVWSLTCAWVGAIVTALFRWMQLLEAALGRLLFPAIAGASLLLVAGLWSLFGPLREWAMRSAVALVMVLAFLSPWLVLGPAYALPQSIDPRSPPAAVSADLAILDRDGDWVARIVGYEVTPEVAVAGRAVSITVCWEALGSVDRDYAVYVQLVGSGQQVIAQRDSYPGLGRFPTSRWQEGDAFCDRYEMVIAEDAPAPGVYHIHAGLYTLEDGARLQVVAGDRQAGGAGVLGRVKVIPSAWPQITPAYALDDTFGGQISLVGFDVDRERVQPGEALGFSLVWETLQQPDADYQVFVHLRSVTERESVMVSSTVPVAIGDGPPLSGSYPTSFWDIGERVIDRRQLQLPEYLCTGRYALTVGLYRLDTMERLALRQGLDAVTLPAMIEVTK